MTKLENNSTSIDATNIPETPKLGVVELFSGIGSYAEALRKNQVQHELRGILEINRYAIEAYKHLHGNIPNFGDISFKKCQKSNSMSPCLSRKDGIVI